MNITTLKKTSVQSIIAIFLVMFVCTYVLMITFLKTPASNKDFIMIGISFMNSSVGVVIGYYFGAAKRQEQDNTADIKTEVTETKNAPEDN